MNKIDFAKLNVHAVKPSRATHGSAGYDLVAVEEKILQPGEITTIPLGFATAMPGNIHCRIESRSGMALKGMVVITGVIDSDYRGEWKVIMGNFSRDPQRIARGDRVAQAVFRDNVSASFLAVDSLEESERGSGGFGSTGA